MSPSSFNSRPPASPLSGAEVYLVPVPFVRAAEFVAAVVASDAEDVDRVKGLLSAVDRLKGLEDADCGAGGGVGARALVCIGGRDGGPTDMGRPPGVNARVREMPIPLWLDKVSTECE